MPGRHAKQAALAATPAPPAVHAATLQQWRTVGARGQAADRFRRGDDVSAWAAFMQAWRSSGTARGSQGGLACGQLARRGCRPLIERETESIRT